MTAEVAVLNAGAVALAADSAVTIGGQKIYNSAIKLFSLSSVAPVGIMIHGNSTLMDFPWEIIIKSFKKEHSKKTHERLEDYATSFIEYIEINNTKFLSLETQERHFFNNIESYLWLIYTEIEDHIKNIFEDSGGKVTEKETNDIFKQKINEHYKKLSEKDNIDNFEDSFFSKLEEKHKNKIIELIREIFNNFKLTSQIIKRILSISIFLVTKKIFHGESTGIVIAGYGESDYHPAIETYKIEGFYDNKLKYSRIEEKSKRLFHGDQCSIIPFAQDDMIAAFMSGINSGVHRFISKYLQITFDKLPDILDIKDLKGTNKEIEKTIKRYKENINVLSDDFFDEV
ncbi:MAG: hypothetical protein MJA29_06925, partial [Candidatus Omnitrophica bacterium]|nr:hypothetical protein [Candidatus Omnitrophota bacterium]